MVGVSRQLLQPQRGKRGKKIRYQKRNQVETVTDTLSGLGSLGFRWRWGYWGKVSVQPQSNSHQSLMD